MDEANFVLAVAVVSIIKGEATTKEAAEKKRYSRANYYTYHVRRASVIHAQT